MPHIVTGALKDYDWGIVDGLARWHAPTGAPQAELWFGTHPSGPTLVVVGPDAGRALADLDEHRGMPLVKLLAAGSPLSIQVHPDAELADRGWSAGSDLFADDAEKSEMLVALTPFDIHAGWREPNAAAAALGGAGVDADVIDLVRAGDHVEAIRHMIADGSPGAAARIVDAAREAGWPDGDVAALDRVVTAFPGDPGILVTALLDHDILPPGHAVAVAAGIVHSYVGGLGVEVMTSSDNVLRLGLTSKAVSVEHALAAVRPDRAPERLGGAVGDLLAPAGMPFDLVLADGPRELPAGRHRIVLAWEGAVAISSGAGAGEIVREGQAGVWAPGEGPATVTPEGIAIVVTGDA
jgi:mannose-6-phosphate isomerase